ncbi:MAG: hypothetical protein Q8P76_02495 [bacterium]|nr:hypothetical protein [bacterium]
MATKLSSKIIITVLILAIILTPFNRGLQLQKTNASWLSEAIDALDPTNVEINFDAEKFKQDCYAAGVPHDQCDQAAADQQAAVDEANAEDDGGFLDFLDALSIGEVTVAALGVFYLAVCLPTTQVPVATGVGAAGIATAAGTGLGPGPAAAVPFITSVCDSIKKALNQAFKQQILQALVNDITAWIKRGYKGKVIVTDWRELVSNAGQAAVGEFAQSIGAGFLCSPFNFQIQFLLTEHPDFDTKARCTLDDIVGNIDNFYTDFRQGGWIAYQTSWAPQNNFYGATLLAIREANRVHDEAADAAKNEGIANQGFLSQKNCVTVALPGGGTKEQCTTTNPGSLIGNAAAEVLVKTPIGAVIGADELGGYLKVIIDTALNELIKKQVDDVKQGF